jgi:hypothetical protein
LICSSLVCHFDWQKQIAADAVEPDVLSKVECLKSSCWQLPLNLRLLGLELWTLESDVIGDAAVMTGG